MSSVGAEQRHRLWQYALASAVIAVTALATSGLRTTIASAEPCTFVVLGRVVDPARVTECIGENLQERDFYEADLRQAKLSHSVFSGVSMVGTELNYADLTYANLSNVNFNGTVLSHANLTGADLAGAKFSTNADIEHMEVTGTQLMPFSGWHSSVTVQNLLDNAGWRISHHRIRGIKPYAVKAEGQTLAADVTIKPAQQPYSVIVEYRTEAVNQTKRPAWGRLEVKVDP